MNDADYSKAMQEYKDYVKGEQEYEKYRQEHHCCSNCRCYYEEYGYDLCTCLDNCEDDINSETKCKEWR